MKDFLNHVKSVVVADFKSSFVPFNRSRDPLGLQIN